MDKKSWTKRWSAKKVTKTRLQLPSTKFFKLWHKNLQAGLPVTATENQEEATKLLQAIRTYGFDCSIEVFGYIGKGYVYNPEFKENIDKFGPGTAQYTSDVMPIMSKLRQNKIGGAILPIFTKSSTICLIIFLPHLVSHGQIYIKKLFKIVGMEFLLFCSSREIEVKTMVTDTNFLLHRNRFSIFPKGDFE